MKYGELLVTERELELARRWSHGSDDKSDYAWAIVRYCQAQIHSRKDVEHGLTLVRAALALERKRERSNG